MRKPPSDSPKLFNTHLSLWNSEHETVTDSSYTAFHLKDGTESFLFHVADEANYKYLWYDPQTKEFRIYADEAVSMKVEDYLDITSGMVNYSPDKEYRFANATVYNGEGLAGALAASKATSADTYISVPSDVKGYLMIFDSATDTSLYVIDTKGLDRAGKTYEFTPVQVSEDSYVLVNLIGGEIKLDRWHANPTFLVTWNLPDSQSSDITITFTNIPDIAKNGEVITVTMTASEACWLYFAGHENKHSVASAELEIGGNGTYWYIVVRNGKAMVDCLEINCFQ